MYKMTMIDLVCQRLEDKVSNPDSKEHHEMEEKIRKYSAELIKLTSFELVDEFLSANNFLSAIECDHYYKSGFSTGMKLAFEIMQYSLKKEEAPPARAGQIGDDSYYQLQL